MLASAPLFPKFVSDRAAMYHELRKRGTCRRGAADLRAAGRACARSRASIVDPVGRNLLPGRRRLRDLPYLLLVLAPLFWSGNFIVGRAVRDTVPPVALAFWRWFGG